VQSIDSLSKNALTIEQQRHIDREIRNMFFRANMLVRKLENVQLLLKSLYLNHIV